MVEFVNFKAYPHPLGGEIDISYDYSETITDDCETFLFKKDTDFNESDIYSFLNNNTNPGNLTIWQIQNYLKKTWDYKVEVGKNYYYKAIIQRKTTKSDGSILVERSRIVETKVTQTISEVIISTVDMKQMVMDGIKKLVKAITDKINKDNPGLPHEIDLQVWDHFPPVTEPVQFFVVSRASSDEGMKYWSNTYYRNSDILIKGDVESETINVTWLTVNNPIMRDQLTKVMRGTRFWLYKYLKRQFQTGVLSVGITMMADGDENPEDQLHLFYSGMLIHFLIETKLIINQPSALQESIKVVLGFDVDKPNG